ncbi:MAG: hypothetical protein AB1458_14895 [Bacteroidota bacterium]
MAKTSLRIFTFLAVILPVPGLRAQIIAEEEPRMLYYESTHQRIRKLRDMKDFRDVFHKDKFLLGRKRIWGRIFYHTGRVMIDDGRELYPEIRQAIGFYTRIRFFEEFSFNTTFFKDFNPAATARWTSDYNYSIGRYHWKPKRFNFGYENYLNNKYSDNWEVFRRKFLEGYYFVSYSHLLPKKVMDKIRIDSTSQIKFSYVTRYAIKYRDEHEVTHGGLFAGKPTFGAGMRYTIVWNIYIEGAVYLYVSEEKKQPWDPDYSYGFGYFDWRHFRFSLTYGNWAINRFPWNKTAYPYYGFPDGDFRFVVNWIW